MTGPTAASPSGSADRVLQANLRALRRTDPQAADRLLAWAAQADINALDVRVADTPSGLPSLELAGRAWLHSRYDPQREAEAWADRAATDVSVVAVYGFGLGYHVQALLARPALSKVVVIEPEPAVLWTALRTRRLEGVLSDPRLELLYGLSTEEAAAHLQVRILQAAVEEGWRFAALPGYTRAFSQQIAETQDAVLRRLRLERVNVATHEFWAFQWIYNVLTNLRHVQGRPFVESWFGALRGRPAILVAAGPSVTPNLPLLRELKGRTPIVAAGSGLGPLLEHGIEPDLVVSIDGSPANYRHFEGRVTQAPLVFSPQIHPRILDEYRGPLVPMTMESDHVLRYICHLCHVEPVTIPSGPSVANVTLAVLHRMGANPIILVGQDLAYPTDKTHADGVPTAATVDDQARADLYQVPRIGGGTVGTTPGMLTMLYWTEAYLARHPDLEVVNTSHFGAHIEGTREMPLAAAIATWDLRQGTWQLPPWEESPGERAAALLDRRRLADLRQRLLKDFEPARRVVEDARRAARRLLASLERPGGRLGRDDPAYRELERSRRRLEETSAFRHLLRHVLHYRRLGLLPPRPQDDVAAWARRCLTAVQLASEAMAFVDRLLQENFHAPGSGSPGDAPRPM